MIRGRVNPRREATLRFRVRDVGAAAEADVEAVIDTGFSGSLTLPASLVSRLGLAVTRGGRIALADASVRQFDVCAVEVWWDGRWRQVLAYVFGRDEVLAGMRLLAGHELRIQVRPGGDVEVRPLP